LASMARTPSSVSLCVRFSNIPPFFTSVLVLLPSVYAHAVCSWPALGSEKPWYQDASHLSTFQGTPWEGSDLDGSTRLDVTGAVKSGTSCLHCGEVHMCAAVLVLGCNMSLWLHDHVPMYT
jgi:hypothetical protein